MATPTTLDTKIGILAELMATLGPDTHGGLDTIQALRMIAATAEAAQRDAVALARAEGETWESIARYLDTTRQAAWERYR